MNQARIEQLARLDDEVWALTPMHPRDTTKAPACPHTTRAGGEKIGTGTWAEWRREGTGAGIHYYETPIVTD